MREQRTLSPAEEDGQIDAAILKARRFAAPEGAEQPRLRRWLP